MLLCDVVLDGVELDWSIHVPLMLHIVFLAMDHTRYFIIVAKSCLNYTHGRTLTYELFIHISTFFRLIKRSSKYLSEVDSNLV